MKTIHNTRQTSLLAFHSLKDLNGRQAQVYGVIRNHGPISNLQVAEILKMPINSIVPRVFQIRAKGLVQESHRSESPLTGRTVIFWQTVE